MDVIEEIDNKLGNERYKSNFALVEWYEACASLTDKIESKLELFAFIFL